MCSSHHIYMKETTVGYPGNVAPHDGKECCGARSRSAVIGGMQRPAEIVRRNTGSRCIARFIISSPPPRRPASRPFATTTVSVALSRMCTPPRVAFLIGLRSEQSLSPSAVQTRISWHASTGHRRTRKDTKPQ